MRYYMHDAKPSTPRELTKNFILMIQNVLCQKIAQYFLIPIKIIEFIVTGLEHKVSVNKKL